MADIRHVKSLGKGWREHEVLPLRIGDGHIVDRFNVLSAPQAFHGGDEALEARIQGESRYGLVICLTPLNSFRMFLRAKACRLAVCYEP